MTGTPVAPRRLPPGSLVTVRPGGGFAEQPADGSTRVRLVPARDAGTHRVGQEPTDGRVELDDPGECRGYRLPDRAPGPLGGPAEPARPAPEPGCRGDLGE